MMNLVDKLKKSLSLNQGKNELTEHFPAFVKNRKAMLKELHDSQANGHLIGVYSRALGEGMFLTGVDNIESEAGREVIVFETYDMSGQILSRTRVSLDEIKMVCPFNTAYVNPVLSNTRFKHTTEHW
jgi:hypothetical protein